ncbi:MAG: hypothetical protein HGB27_08525 [Chlorobiaceae bacterium]|nr:hypothetical protein [Chlorobiaceae bacterium]
MSALKMVLSPGMVLSASEVRRLEADWADGDRQCAATNREQDRNPSDRSENSFRARIALQLGATAAAMAIFPEMKLTSLGTLPGIGELATGALAVPATMLLSLAIMNAVRKIDSQYALAGAASLAALGAFGILSWLNSTVLLLALSVASAGAVGLFLLTGRSRSGHSGFRPLADIAGFLLAVVALSMPQATGGAVSPAVALTALALPLVNLVSVALGRVMNGHSPFMTDGYPGFSGTSHRVLVSLSLVFPLLAIAAAVLEVSDAMLFISLAGLCAAYHAVSRRPDYNQGS